MFQIVKYKYLVRRLWILRGPFAYVGGNTNILKIYLQVHVGLNAIACSGHGKMKMNRFIKEHLGLLRVVPINKYMELLRLVT